jgi:myo-inositol 2-dehydrogenase/D-chiro-inositol 1-dehydrogenase
MNRPVSKLIPRREFLAGAAVSAGTVAFVKPGSVRGTQANSAIELGIIGSGGRGIWLGNLANKETQMRVVALQDPFEDRVTRGGEKLGIDRSRCYKGLEAYKDLLASKLDAVAIESPPYFHPEQALAAAQAGKHVYLAKPVAVDVPGCRKILEAGEKAKGKLSFYVDFQTRVNPLFMEAARRVHQGALGKIVSGQVYYQAGRLKPQADPADQGDAARLRNWVFDIALSGDIIVEQNVHVLDVANWFLGSRPVKAFGTGGRKARIDVGDCWDHFVVTYWYPNDVPISFSSGQYLKGFDDLCTRIFGSEGTVDAHYEGPVSIKGTNPYEGGSTKGLYTSGAIANLKLFEESLRARKYLNNAAECTDSTLTGILGRKTAYEGRLVTWEEMLKDDKAYKVPLKV